MARYLSAAWFEEVARQQPAGEPAEPVLTLAQVVTGAPGVPGGEVRYRVVVGRDGAVLRAGDGPGADVTFTADWATAKAVADGSLSMQAALGAGRVRVGGDLGLLATHQALLSGLDPVPEPVRAATTWEAEGE
jgi:hypothetical protein